MRVLITQRVWLAAALAPLVPSIILLALSLISNPYEGMWVIMLVLPVSYATTLVPGLPLYLLFRGISWDSAIGCIFIGVVCSSTATAFFMRHSIQDALSAGVASAWYPAASLATFAALLGSAAGFTFWKISHPSDT